MVKLAEKPVLVGQLTAMVVVFSINRLELSVAFIVAKYIVKSTLNENDCEHLGLQF